MIIENYTKCKFASICNEFEGIKENIKKDPLLESYLLKANKILKENILIQIIKSSSSISVSQLSSMTLESNNVVLEIIYSLINNGQINCRIDLINNVIVTNDINQNSVVMQKVLENSQKTYSNCIYGLLSNTVKVKINLDYMTKRSNFTEHKIDNDKFDISGILSEMGRSGGYGGMAGRMGGYGGMAGMGRRDDDSD